MKLHPRTPIVTKARLQLDNALWDMISHHQLTFVETLQILHELTAAQLKFMLRAERHPEDPNKKGDEE